jgi:hypothetical protein
MVTVATGNRAIHPIPRKYNRTATTNNAGGRTNACQNNFVIPRKLHPCFDLVPFSMTTTFVDFKHDGKEFIVQTVFSKGKEDVGIVFTSGKQSWATAVRPANKSRAVALSDDEFLETVVKALVSQDSKTYDFSVSVLRTRGVLRRLVR